MSNTFKQIEVNPVTRSRGQYQLTVLLIQFYNSSECPMQLRLKKPRKAKINTGSCGATSYNEMQELREYTSSTELQNMDHKLFVVERMCCRDGMGVAITRCWVGLD